MVEQSTHQPPTRPYKGDQRPYWKIVLWETSKDAWTLVVDCKWVRVAIGALITAIMVGLIARLRSIAAAIDALRDTGLGLAALTIALVVVWLAQLFWFTPKRLLCASLESEATLTQKLRGFEDKREERKQNSLRLANVIKRRTEDIVIQLLDGATDAQLFESLEFRCHELPGRMPIIEPLLIINCKREDENHVWPSFVQLANNAEMVNKMAAQMMSPKTASKQVAERLLRTATEIYRLTDAQIPKEALTKFSPGSELA